ncbi:Mitochodrial transcription termination factor-related protein [Corchorus olitorius]|uniref:Mitochodrial transcription termination factor-related protein n=1 Tax=Corchorus olitorius TaxID=93759 RepID=A0A1R3FZX6_9ROSI|nr:Mitochodrial transcription termination factor-related protein [Corchorus olitorius]
MASFRKAITFKYRLLATHLFSTVPPKASQYRNQISLANLLQRYGFPGFRFNDEVLTSVLEGFPRVTIMNESEIYEKIEFLGRIGIPRYGIERVFYVFPEVLRLNVENRLKQLLEEFLELGFSENEVREEIVRDPRVFGMELGEMSRSLGLLRTLKCRVPIKQRICGEGEYRAGLQVKLIVDCLCKYGLIRREAFKVPEYLGVDFDKQIVPRYNVIEYLGLKGAMGFEVGLKSLIKPSRLRFYNFYVKPYPECEKMFGRFAQDVGLQRGHPVGMWKLFKPQQYTESKDDVENIKSFIEPLVANEATGG